jgi:hypothetical protein
MSEYADAHRSKDAKARVAKYLGKPAGNIDASGWREKTDIGTPHQTGKAPEKRAFKKGGKVEGKNVHHHAGRKARAMGGPDVEVPAPQNAGPLGGGLYGMKSAPVRSPVLKDGGMEDGMAPKAPATPSSGPYQIVHRETGRVVGKANTLNGARASRDRNDNKYGSYAHKIVDLSDGRSRLKDGGDAERKSRASGGKASKGKMNVNIIIGGHDDKPPMPPMMPPPGPPPGMPSGSPLVPPAPGGMPPQAPQGMPMRPPGQ